MVMTDDENENKYSHSKLYIHGYRNVIEYIYIYPVLASETCLASGSRDTSVSLWDVATSTRLLHR
jgi:hypothetical protein